MSQLCTSTARVSHVLRHVAVALVVACSAPDYQVPGAEPVSPSAAAPTNESGGADVSGGTSATTTGDSGGSSTAASATTGGKTSATSGGTIGSGGTSGTEAEAGGSGGTSSTTTPDSGGATSTSATGGTAMVTGDSGGTSSTTTTASGGATSTSASGGTTAATGGSTTTTTGTGGQPAANALNCTSNADCSTFAATKICDTATSRCVECLPGQTVCPAGLYCGVDKECQVGCAADADCGAMTCDTTTHLCTDCAATDAGVANSCPVGTRCDATSGDCVRGCNNSANCPANWTCCAQNCVNLRLDENNCNSCGTTCTKPDATVQCLNAACRVDICKQGYGDCNGQYSDGCEVDLLSANANCGVCGNACATPLVCKNGICSNPDCSAGYADCNVGIQDGCETNTDRDPLNCGGCGNRCSTANGTPSCDAGQCLMSCNSGWGNCNQNANDGCETDLTSTADHCGSCAISCANDHGTSTCTAGNCSPTCAAGFADCDGNPSNGCEATVSSDPNHCGACTTVCSLPNATPACTNGTCSIASCEPNSADCNSTPADGCETNLQASATHCGSCSTACDSTNGVAACSSGSCTITCNTGFANCDGSVANGCEADLTQNVDHCSTCTTVCPDGTNGTAICTAGVCGVSNCAPPYGDCDNNPATGCESDENNDPNNCGGCGSKCNIPNANAQCTLGVCGISTCKAGFADCNGNLADGCEANVNIDINNCAACGNRCAPANAVGSCVSGACQVTSCTSPFQNCDGIASNGCEADVTNSAAHCGACGTACSSDHGTPSCSAGVCSITCAAGFGNCDGNVSNGCETPTTSDATHCGSCTTACLPTNASGTCQNSSCKIGTCDSGFADCDANYANGCEARLTTNAANCGACGNVCSSTNGTASCANGQCSITCGSGYGNCDAAVSNGCETNLTNSLQNCSGCGVNCALANASESCTAAVCTLGTCDSGFANCDGNATNGCEANLMAEPTHCGNCANACSLANATASCSSGVCAIASCNTGYSNCDGNAGTGCEATLNTTTNCGACGTPCSRNNATASCSTGSCTLVSCNSGFGNCDANTSNGCEINLNSDVTHCGTCTTVCSAAGGTPVCNSGVCGISGCTTGYGDCDGIPGNGCEANVNTNVNNCGACGNVCAFANAGASCVSGVCTIGACNSGYGNCDSNASNGCEATLNTTTNCAACGTACSRANATASCSTGSCALVSCNSGFGNCDANATNGCEASLQTDAANCNACGSACSSTNGTASCSAGACQITCSSGYGNCDSNVANGCEASLNTDTSHCGTCSTVCGSSNGTPACSSGVCGITCNSGYGNCDGSSANGCETNTNTNVNYCSNCSTACNSTNGTASCSSGTCGIACSSGYGNCDSNASNGCEVNLTNNALHCGSCPTACSYANASGVCSSSSCQLGTCNTGFGNCDANASNGCEAALTTTSNCGSCGATCTNANGTTACTAGACVPSCSSGYASCDSNANNGCEQNTATDLNHCGTCTTVCSYANATPSCSSGACQMGACSYLYGNCNAITSDGCEKSLAADVSNCGACSNVCSSSHGTASCSGGACSISCSSGYGNCDASVSNGCEAALTSLTNCGACGTACSRANATATCSTGSCAISSCNSGYGNCDGNAANGCETALNTTTNCGACGTACTNANGTTTCSSGVCSPSCSSGYGSCDSNANNGCEAALTSLTNCGACGTACSRANATATCSTGSCAISSCNSGHYDCDGNSSNGCESATACGGCDAGVAFCDTFEDGNANGWNPGGGTWTVTTDSSNYVYRGGNGSQESLESATAALTNQTVQANIKVTAFGGTGSSYRAGIIARYTGSSVFYTFSIDQAGNLTLRKSTSNISSATGTCGSTASGVDPMTWNTYKIVVSGAPGNVNLKTYFNGTLVHDCTTTASGSPANGSAGFLTYGTGTIAMFDIFQVSSP